jgi:hypothetical protein
MNKRIALKRQPEERHSTASLGESSDLTSKILRAEREQNADQTRIEEAITKAGAEIGALERRPLGPEGMQRSIITIRDQTVLNIRDVRRNMVKRTIAAKNMREMVDDVLRQRSRFASQDIEDANLRTRYFELLGRTPTFRLIRHLQDAVHAGDFACKESIRFEFQCRDDRDEYTKSFEKVLAENALYDPVEMRKRLANICIAAEKTDARITEFLTRTRCMQASRGLLGVAEKHQMHYLRRQKSSTGLNAQ